MSDRQPLGKGEAEALLDAFGLETVCDRIVEGHSYRAICAEVGISLGAFVRWISLDGERSARTRESRIVAAQTYDEMAGDGIKTAANAFELAKARELGFHLRWKASKVNPRDYGDKLQVDNTHAMVNLSDDELERRASQYRTQIAAAEAPPVVHELPPPADAP